MNVNSQQIRSERHIEIGSLIRRDAGIVMDRWCRRAVEEQPNAVRVHHEVLRDQLADLLEALGKSLAESDDPDTCRHRVPALEHGEQRWHTGWSLPELVRDFQLLRLVLVEYLDETLERTLRCREVLAVGLALDEAIAASVGMYVSNREEYVAQVERACTERESQAEEARLRQQAALLKEANRRKDEFLALVSHELRNPLAAIRNAVEALKLLSPVGTDLRRAGEVISRQAETLTKVVDDLLDVSRIGYGKVQLKKELVDLAGVVARAVETSRPIIETRRHELRLLLPPDPLQLEADPARLVQVIANLLNNAAKYTPPGGNIGLTVERAGSEVVLRIRDNGVGIPAEMLPRVFDLFTQHEGSLDRSEGGLGIGLTLVRSLVEIHGGSVQAFSNGPGQGAEFVVRLPASMDLPEPPAPDKRELPLSAPVSARHILIVDDNRDAAESLAMLLRLCGHDARTAYDGLSAIEAAQAKCPDLILLDIGMPRMDGYEVARRLHQEPGLENVLLAALTGYGAEEDRRRAQEAGFATHLVKPVNLDDLQTLLTRLEMGADRNKQT